MPLPKEGIQSQKWIATCQTKLWPQTLRKWAVVRGFYARFVSHILKGVLKNFDFSQTAVVKAGCISH